MQGLIQTDQMSLRIESNRTSSQESIRSAVSQGLAKRTPVCVCTHVCVCASNKTFWGGGGWEEGEEGELAARVWGVTSYYECGMRQAYGAG